MVTGCSVVAGRVAQGVASAQVISDLRAVRLQATASARLPDGRDLEEHYACVTESMGRAYRTKFIARAGKSANR